MVQGLGLDWNMPPNSTANEYVARLLWSTSIEFPAGPGHFLARAPR